MENHAIKSIRCATTADGNIEAATSYFITSTQRLVVDRRTGEVIESNVKEGTDMFRWLVNAAREHIAK